MIIYVILYDVALFLALTPYLRLKHFLGYVLYCVVVDRGRMLHQQACNVSASRASSLIR